MVWHRETQNWLRRGFCFPQHECLLNSSTEALRPRALNMRIFLQKYFGRSSAAHTEAWLSSQRFTWSYLEEIHSGELLLI
jgi:hypothetical protein